MLQNIDLSGKTALIMGAGRGIGLAGCTVPFPRSLVERRVPRSAQASRSDIA